MNKQIDQEKLRFQIQKHESFAIEFLTDDGFKIGVDHNRAYVDFQHRMRVKPVSGGLPVAEILSKPLPFTTLLPQVMELLIDATILLPHAGSRSVNSIGIVTTTQSNEEDLPPGLRKFIEYLGRPWGAIPESINTQISSVVQRKDHYTDKVIHHVIKKDESLTDDNLILVKIDWQRRFATKIPITQDRLQKESAVCERDALKYFEDMAEGNLFDEELISASV